MTKPHVFDGTETIVAIATSTLADLLASFEEPLWDGVREGYTVADVEAAIEAGRAHTQRLLARDQVPLSTHIARIAHLVRTWANDGSDPIDIEVDSTGWPFLEDGHHRLAAAITRGDEVTYARIGGFLDAAEATFGVRID